MAYCDAADVQKQLQHITLSTTSKPTEAQVEEFADQIGDEMDARFNAAGIDTPITDEDKYRYVKRIAVHGVLAEVYRSLDMGGEAASTFQGLYEKALTVVEKTPDILRETEVVDTSPSGSTAGDRAFEKGRRDW